MEKLCRFAIGAAKPTWTSKALVEPVAGVAWDDRTALVWSGSEVALLDSETGQSIWRRQLAFDDAATRPTDATPLIGQVRVLSDAVVVPTRDGWVTALRRDSGKTLWRVRLSAQPVLRLAATDEFVAAFAPGQMIEYRVILDAWTGRADPSGAERGSDPGERIAELR